MSKKRRTKIEVIRDVLEIVRKSEEVKKTEIVYGANLNFERASGILKWLIAGGFIVSGSNRYKITEKGEDILRELEKVATLFKP
ncbi:MAG: transcriptional regulator [Methanomicrobia archaeon]|nr:transcriptional regulator [Methanomicrobia archaeon]